MKRIVFLMWNLKKYGCNIQIFDYVRDLRNKGFSVEIYYIFRGLHSISDCGIPCESFLKLFLSGKSVDILVCSGFWPVAYLALLFPVKRKIYYLQALDSSLHENVFLKFLAETSYRLNFEKVVISDFLKQKLEAYSSCPIKVMPHGIDYARFSSPGADLSNLKSRKLKVLSVLSGYHRIKGPDLLVNIVKEIKKRRSDISFTLVSFEKTSYSPIFDRFISDPASNELLEEYCRADLFLATSIQEGFFLPALEAMACKVPVVMTDSGGVREYAKNGYNCLLARDASEIIKKRLVEYVLHNQRLRKKLIENGFATAKKFSFQKASERWIRYLDN
ncbi:glycosyltransferase family 4 protein [Candidatus Gottesmanbacteria bacterium]|nr:glycosyltransferase family 4 protein [Candidatus Gottesmanbacteria bacterium]